MILILTQCFPPAIGGIEQLMKGLADGLAARGLHVAVYADARGRSAERRFDAAVAYPLHCFAGFKPLRRRRKTRAIAKALAEGKISDIFCFRRALRGGKIRRCGRGGNRR